MISNYISLPIFLISLAVGLFVVYIFGPEKKVVYVYPTPENIKKMLIRDKTGGCFKYEPTEVDCPSNLESVFSPPIQT
jgi:hypothetical protein